MTFQISLHMKSSGKDNRSGSTFVNNDHIRIVLLKMFTFNLIQFAFRLPLYPCRTRYTFKAHNVHLPGKHDETAIIIHISLFRFLQNLSLKYNIWLLNMNWWIS